MHEIEQSLLSSHTRQFLETPSQTFFLTNRRFWPETTFFLDRYFKKVINNYKLYNLCTGATVVRYSPGFVPISNCVLSSGGDLNCSQLTDGSCDHSMDLGVVCRTYSDVKEISEQCTSMNLVAATDPTCLPSKHACIHIRTYKH